MFQTVPFSENHIRSQVVSLHHVVKQMLDSYQKRFEKVCVDILPTLGGDTSLRQSMAYSLQSGGKRLRPAIVWMVAEAIHSIHSVDLAALAVEFFHVSSLIIDDLPCMDNDDIRRGVPTTHKAFSESEAILASYALTAAGFELLSRIPLPSAREGPVLRAIYAKVSRAIGLPGLIGGQYLDLHPAKFDTASICTIIDLKTGALFEVSFILGWLCGGGGLEKLDDLHTLAMHFGRAFQIVDDIDDLEQDKAAGKNVNYALLFGFENACERVCCYVDQFCSMAAKLGIEDSPIVTLATAMRSIGSSS